MGVGSFFDYPGDEATSERPAELVFLGGLRQEDWDTLLAHMERRRYRAGEIVMAAGDADRSLHLVADGTVEVLVAGRRGQRSTATYGPGTVLGEVAFFDGRPRSATVQAVADAEVLRLGMDGFEVLAARYPDLAREVLLDLGRILAARLRQVESLTVN